MVARSYNYFGAHSFLGAVVTDKFYREYTQFSNQLYRDVAAAIKLVKTNPQKVAQILAEDAGGNPTPRQFKQWIGNPAITYTTRPRGLMRTASFMSRTGQLPGRLPSSWRDLVFPPVHPTNGS